MTNINEIIEYVEFNNEKIVPLTYLLENIVEIYDVKIFFTDYIYDPELTTDEWSYTYSVKNKKENLLEFTYYISGSFTLFIDGNQILISNQLTLLDYLKYQFNFKLYESEDNEEMNSSEKELYITPSSREEMLKILFNDNMERTENGYYQKYSKLEMGISIQLFISAVAEEMFKLMDEQGITDKDDRKNMCISFANEVKRMVKIYSGIDTLELFK